MKEAGEDVSLHSGAYSLTSPLARNSRRRLASIFMRIVEQEKPDLVHVFGTELPHALVAVQKTVALRLPLLLSMQGIVTSIADYVTQGLPHEVIRGATIRNRLRRDGVKGLQSTYAKRGVAEVEAIKLASNIMGRTGFDRSFVISHNPSATYHHGEELLRPAFYDAIWDSDRCVPYRLFMSQGANPIKGVHTALKALAIVKQSFPDATLAVGGRSRVPTMSLRARLEQTSYDRYLGEMLRDLDLESSVEFTGPLREEAMVDQLVRANVFLLPSSIENSSNSLAEAMMVGTPSIVAYVGGIPDMVEHRRDALCFPSGSAETLAQLVMEVLRAPRLAKDISEAARERARSRHDRQASVANLSRVYDTLIKRR